MALENPVLVADYKQDTNAAAQDAHDMNNPIADDRAQNNRMVYIGDDNHRNNDNVPGIQRTDAEELAQLALKFTTAIILHPLEYAKTLIQLGHEPLPPHAGKSIMGRSVMVYPNVFQYVGHIHRTDGFQGCFRGLAPKLVGSVCGTIFSERIAWHLGLSGQVDISKPIHERTFAEFKKGLQLDVMMSATSTIIAHPFHVVSVRIMAQFVGREDIYQSISDSIREIWATEGIAGFFSGLIPKLIWNVGTIVLASSAIYVLNKYVIKQKILRQYNAGIVQLACTTMLYPFQTVGTCSIVSGSRLVAGNPPNMPIYTNWIECFKDMHAEGTLRRGGTLFMRTLNTSIVKTNVISQTELANTAAAAAVDIGTKMF